MASATRIAFSPDAGTNEGRRSPRITVVQQSTNDDVLAAATLQVVPQQLAEAAADG